MSVLVSDKPQRAIDYPVARKSKSSDLVIFFTSPCTGVVLVSNGARQVGEYARGLSDSESEHWYPVEVTIRG